MARPIKDGVDYFPKDTDFYEDDKVKLLRAEFGAKGMYVLDYLLCDLYGKNGYFMKWDKNKCFLVSDGAGCGCNPEFITEFIYGCIRCSFFNDRVFDVFGILTSPGIQRRYIRMFNSRDEIQIYKEYWLLDTGNKKDVPASVLGKLTLKNLKSTENPDKSTESPDKSTENPQNRVEDIKVEDTKENNSCLTDIIAYLNERAGTSYKASSKTTKEHISARLREGFSLDNFKTVIDKKCSDWKGTDFEQYLRPSTLFGTKFEGYLNANIKKGGDMSDGCPEWKSFKGSRR